MRFVFLSRWLLLRCVRRAQGFTLLPPKNRRLLTNKSLRLSNLSTGCVINLNKLGRKYYLLDFFCISVAILRKSCPCLEQRGMGEG